MSKARPHHNVLEHMTRSEAEKIIYEANLGKEDERIARLYFVDKLPQIDIGFEVMLDRKTVGIRLKDITTRMLKAAESRSLP